MQGDFRWAIEAHPNYGSARSHGGITLHSVVAPGTLAEAARAIFKGLQAGLAKGKANWKFGLSDWEIGRLGRWLVGHKGNDSTKMGCVQVSYEESVTPT